MSAGCVLRPRGVQTDKTAEALKEFFNEFTGILKPIPGEELDKAKNYVALGFPPSSRRTAIWRQDGRAGRARPARRVFPELRPRGPGR